MKKSFLTILSLVLVAACAPKVEPQLVAEPDLVTLRLADAADRAAKSLEKLAAVESTRTPVDLPPLAAGAPQELRRSITVEWTGPVEPLLQKISDRAGYHFQLSGSDPAVALVVEVNAFRKPIIEVLRDIGLQLGDRAQVNVDARAQTIEVVYANMLIE
jgi:defect-in-organelle-trafficking protein DotD